MTTELAEAYAELHAEVLTPISKLLQAHLEKLFDGVPRIDRISCRAKSSDSFLEKALKCDEKGNLKYDDPIYEIQDQLGARLTVFYLQDVKQVSDLANKYLKKIESQKKEPLGDSEFGYFGEHLIMRLPDDVIPEGCEDRAPEFFELQVKTLFQHAWSESDHDLGYKSVRNLSSSEKRQVAFSAAQSWGADRVFAELASKLVFANENDRQAGNSARP